MKVRVTLIFEEDIDVGDFTESEAVVIEQVELEEEFRDYIFSDKTELKSLTVERIEI